MALQSSLRGSSLPLPVTANPTPVGTADLLPNSVSHAAAAPPPSVNPPVSAPRVSEWDFRTWGEGGMGVWQAGFAAADAGPSMEDHARYNSSHRATGQAVSDCRPRSKKPDPEHKPPVSAERAAVPSKCAVAITAKGLQFLTSGDKLETLLPRCESAMAWNCCWS